MATEYPNSGRLVHNKYKEAGDRKPDMTGEIIMTRTALKGLLEEHDGDDIVIKLSAWQMSGQWGPWLRISWNNYRKPDVQKPQPVNQIPISDQDIPF